MAFSIFKRLDIFDACHFSQGSYETEEELLRLINSIYDHSPLTNLSSASLLGLES